MHEEIDPVLRPTYEDETRRVRQLRLARLLALLAAGGGGEIGLIGLAEHSPPVEIAGGALLAAALASRFVIGHLLRAEEQRVTDIAALSPYESDFSQGEDP